VTYFKVFGILLAMLSGMLTILAITMLSQAHGRDADDIYLSLLEKHSTIQVLALAMLTMGAAALVLIFGTESRKQADRIAALERKLIERETDRPPQT
jgi:acyl-coenzyme A synthetase/AMP-(fatty) acid ligase